MRTPKGYTTLDLVANEIGDVLDNDSFVDYGTTLIAQAEDYIDRYTGRAWAVVSPVVDELHTVTGPYLYLKHAPVTTITSLRVRVGAVGATETTLTAGTEYELIDPVHGIMLINAGYPFGFDVVVNTTEYAGYILRVSYTTTTPVPGDIERAATLLVANWFGSRGSVAMAAGIKSYSVGTDLAVTFRDDTAAGTRAVPSVITEILNRHRAVLMA